MQLLRPLVVRYMIPLCLVYIEEYVINSVRFSHLSRHQAESPPGRSANTRIPATHHWPLVQPLQVSEGLLPLLESFLFVSPPQLHDIADSRTDQTFVFLSRSSLSIGLPPLPRYLLPLPSIIQFFVLALLSLQSSRFLFSSPAYTPPAIPPTTGSDRTITIVFLLMCLEGLCGGSAYVNTFYHVGREGDQGTREDVKTKMEKEFRIGATGAADSCGEFPHCQWRRKAEMTQAYYSPR